MKTLVLLGSALLATSVAFAEEPVSNETVETNPGTQEQIVEEAQMVEEAAPAVSAAEEVNQVTSPEIVAEEAAPAADQPTDQQAQVGAAGEKKWWQFWAN